MIVAGTGLGAVLAACGDDDDVGPGPTNTPDTGTINPNDSGDDTGSDATADAGSFAKLTIVNATTDLGPDSRLPNGNGAFRVCFKSGTTQANLAVAPYPPLPDRAPASNPAAPAGIYYGTGGTFPSFGLDLSTRIIQPYLMNAYRLLQKGIKNPNTTPPSPGTTCDELIGATADAAIGL